jgi:hypothetical protein
VDIPLKEEVNIDKKDSIEEDLGIRVSKEEVVETPLEEVEDNKHLLLKEKEAVIITMTRKISNVIAVINLGTITLNFEEKLY